MGGGRLVSQKRREKIKLDSFKDSYDLCEEDRKIVRDLRSLTAARNNLSTYVKHPFMNSRLKIKGIKQLKKFNRLYPDNARFYLSNGVEIDFNMKDTIDKIMEIINGNDSLRRAFYPKTESTGSEATSQEEDNPFASFLGMPNQSDQGGQGQLHNMYEEELAGIFGD